MDNREQTIVADLHRYTRNMAVEGVGEEGQKRLLQSKVLVLGCGALGNVAASYLAGAGVGHLTLADFDTVDISNLHRQVMYAEQDAGHSKAATLADRLRRLNSTIDIEVVERKVDQADAETLFADVDFVVDATDNATTKYMTDLVCERLGKPCCIGGVNDMRGQLTTHTPGTTRYSQIFPPATSHPPKGVMGPLPGIIGAMQALEAIKYITGIGRLLTDRLFIFDGRSFTANIFEIA